MRDTLPSPCPCPVLEDCTEDLAEYFSSAPPRPLLIGEEEPPAFDLNCPTLDEE